MSKLKIGSNDIDFNLPGVDGKNYSLDSFKGKKALALIFSCNHCPYVLAWEDRIISMAKEFQENGIAFVLICVNDAVKYPQDSFENMKKHAAEKNFPFPYLHDESQEIAHYGARYTPEVFLFDKDRKLAYHGAPDDNYEDPSHVNQQYLREAINAILEGKSVSKPETSPIGCTIKWK